MSFSDSWQLILLAILLMYLLIVLVVVILHCGSFRDAVYDIKRSETQANQDYILHVRHGRVLPGSSPYLTKIGYPCWLEVDSDSAVLLERNHEFTRTISGDNVLLERFERIGGIVDLRKQTRTRTIRRFTRDGIPVKTDASMEFRIRPNDSKAIRDALYPLTVQDGGAVTNWAEFVTILGIGEIEDLLSKYRLDELSQIHQASGAITTIEISVRQEIQMEAEKSAVDKLEPRGGELLSLQMKSFLFDEQEVQPVTAQRLETWRIFWINKAELVKLEGDSGVLRKELAARAGAELELIRKIVLGLKPMASKTITAEPLVWLRVVGSLEQVAIDSKAYRFFPKDFMDLVNELRAMGNSASGSQSRSLPLQPSPQPYKPNPETPERIWKYDFEKIQILEAKAAADITGAPVGKNDRVEDMLQMGSVAFIGEGQYVAINLEDGGIYNLSPNFEHFVIRVKGISMDKTSPVNIQDKDLVLVRRPKGIPYKPSNGQVVVAVLQNEVDRRAVLKRYWWFPWGFRLESETSQPGLPQHHALDFDSANKDRSQPVQFIGQAIAVLRPVPKK